MMFVRPMHAAVLSALLFSSGLLGFGGVDEAAAIEAFPGAVGYGKETQGGRYGRIITVDNLNDAGPGSLRACVEATGPRNCVFRVSGTIYLKQSLIAFGPGAAQLSILGQTAPGGGITLTTDPAIDTWKMTPLVAKNTSDVIIRHLRSRPQIDNSVPNVDTVTVENSVRVYIDHFSGSWSTDENFNTHSQATDLTVAYSVWGEGLRNHSKCALIGSDPSGPQDISFFRNLCISNNDRNPDNNHFRGSCIEIVDNVFYNGVSEWGEVFSQQPGGTQISYVGNLFKAGPSTVRHTYAIKWQTVGSVAPPEIFADANDVWAPPNKLITLVEPGTVDRLVRQPACPISVPSFRDPAKAYSDVAKQAGAFPRDDVDRRYFQELAPRNVAGGGTIRSKPGALPALPGGRPYVDADGDGMADSAEARFGAVPGNPDGWIDGDGDGWSNFDEFMQWLSEERIAGRYPS